MKCECGSTKFIENNNLEIHCQKCGTKIVKKVEMMCECGSTEFIEDDIHLEIHCKKCGMVVDEKLNYHIKRDYSPRYEKMGGYSRK